MESGRKLIISIKFRGNRKKAEENVSVVSLVYLWNAAPKFGLLIADRSSAICPSLRLKSLASVILLSLINTLSHKSKGKNRQ